MGYQDYESYMRGILGYNNNDIYNNSYQGYSPVGMQQNYREMNYNNNAELESFYPEIYKITHPVIIKVCRENYGRRMTKELINQMTSEVCNIIDFRDNKTTGVKQNIPLKNGDVRNPNAKEIEEVRDDKEKNYLLNDVVTILIIKELENINFERPHPMPPQYYNPYIYGQRY